MSVDTKIHEHPKKMKSEMKELQGVNRELRKAIKELKKNREGWKKKLSDKQYQLKVQKNTTLAAKTSRDNWQKKCMKKTKKLAEVLSDYEQKEKDMEALIFSQKKETEQLKKELKEKKSL